MRPSFRTLSAFRPCIRQEKIYFHFRAITGNNDACLLISCTCPLASLLPWRSSLPLRLSPVEQPCIRWRPAACAHRGWRLRGRRCGAERDAWTGFCGAGALSRNRSQPRASRTGGRTKAAGAADCHRRAWTPHEKRSARPDPASFAMSDHRRRNRSQRALGSNPCSTSTGGRRWCVICS